MSWPSIIGLAVAFVAGCGSHWVSGIADRDARKSATLMLCAALIFAAVGGVVLSLYAEDMCIDRCPAEVSE